MKKNNLHTLDLNSGPLHQMQVFCHWALDHQSKIPKDSTNQYEFHSELSGLSFLPVTFTSLADLFPKLESLREQLCENSIHLALIVQCQNTYN
jgi:hypothetical protein